eukprot:Gb_11156 [translate_table: standard]
MSDNFDVCGPAYLINPSWENADHRRIIAASLVSGVSVLQGDMKHRRSGATALAYKWWTFFDFQLEETLIDDCDGSVFGAVFQWSGEEPAKQQKSPPRVVVAFRGTIMSCETVVRDLFMDLEILVNRLEKRSRYLKGLEALRKSVRSHGPKHVVIAGHSMGAAIGLLAGRTLMAEDGVNLEAHLFNPPCARSAHHFKTLKVAKDVIHKVFKGNDENSEIYSKFLAVRGWVPFLYVNHHDVICRSYINYFDHPSFSQRDIGDVLSALHSIRHILFSLVGKQSWPWHLIPSANLILPTNATVSDSHKLREWWRHDIQTQRRNCILLSNVKLETLTTLHDKSHT